MTLPLAKNSHTYVLAGGEARVVHHAVIVANDDAAPGREPQDVHAV